MHKRVLKLSQTNQKGFIGVCISSLIQWSSNTYKMSRSQKTYLRSCALSEDSDQPEHLHSLIRIFPGRVLDSQGCIRAV